MASELAMANNAVTHSWRRDEAKLAIVTRYTTVFEIYKDAGTVWHMEN
jgi:hypothetical protein